MMSTMCRLLLYIALPLLVAGCLTACDKTPRGVLSLNDMADLIVDLQLADAYIDSHSAEFDTDSSKLVLKQAIFKKHGITQRDYDSSLVWYAHNMEDYTKAHDKAVGKLQAQYDKLGKSDGKQHATPESMMADGAGQDMERRGMTGPRHAQRKALTSDVSGDSADLWQGNRNYLLTAGAGHGFITFDIAPDANKSPGDRYQLAYKLTRGGNEFKVSLNVDYTDGSTSQMARATHSDGWVTIDVQSDTARQVRRIYGYVGYDIKRGHIGMVDSLSLMRTHLNKSNYGFINAQRLLERDK